ncbi:MAG TPA: ABC transporter permease [Lacunisphaera sp.]|nr:ABC transporter permease [Lacunisphaera sp.]
MNLRPIFTVYLKELRDLLRDRRTVISVVVIPTFVMPVFFFGLGKIATGVINKAKSETPVVMILGGEDSPEIVTALKESKKLHVVKPADDWRQQISEKKVRAAVAIPAGFAAGLKAGAAEEVKIYHYEGELKSNFAVNELEAFFRNLREQTVTTLLEEHSLPARLVKPFEFKRENVAPPERVGGNLVGGFVPYIIILLCFTGAMYPAMDLTAGEKERGTMETLLCSPAARVQLVLGKFLMVLTGSLAAMAMSLGSMAVSAAATGVAFGGRAATMAAAAKAQASGGTMPTIDPLGILGLIAMIFPVAVLFSAVLFTVALFAKSFKEAQSYVGPMIFFVIAPAVIGMLPGIELNARLAMVPILNLSLICREMLSGVWHWNYIALIFASSCVYAAIALALCVKMFNREDVIFRT